MKNKCTAFAIAILILNIRLFSGNLVYSDSLKKDSLKDIGVSVSPSHVNFTAKPGETKTQEIRINNETSSIKKFNISMSDFDMNEKGSTVFLKPGESKYSLSKWLNISPTFVELKPFSDIKIKLTLTVPSTEEGNNAAWCIVKIEETREREKLDDKGNSDKISLGVIPTFAFGIFVYQNPPNVKASKVEIKNFINKNDSVNKSLDLFLHNTGNGIAQCVAYVELTNTTNGKQQRLTVKRFVILPGYKRSYNFKLPKNLEKGKYTALGVLDFGSKEEIEAAEIEFEIN